MENPLPEGRRQLRPEPQQQPQQHAFRQALSSVLPISKSRSSRDTLQALVMHQARKQSGGL